MAKELVVVNKMTSIAGKERGFVLVTSLIMLSLLTLMSLGMFFTSRTATQTSGSAQSTTEAYYYAETAINYISWALYNDAEFDNFAYVSGSYRHPAFGDPTPPANNASVGDFTEFKSYLSDPGPTIVSDAGEGLAGQIMYFDNSPINNGVQQRAICFNSEPDPGVGVALTYPNCMNVQLAPNDSRRIAAEPVMFNISASLPRYIKLEIAEDGTITPSIPKLPHRGPTSVPVAGPVVGEDIPDNGAVVWITAASTTSIDSDIEIYPLAEPVGASCLADGGCPCDGSVIVGTEKACDANTGNWLHGQVVGGVWEPPYRLAAYALGYVNGQPTHLIRAIIY